MVPGMVGLRYVVQILEIENNFVIYNNKDVWNKAIEAIRTKWPEPPLDGPLYVQDTPSVIADLVASATDGRDLIDNGPSLNGTWTEFIQCPSNVTWEKLPAGLCHCAWHGRVKANWKLSNNMLNSCPDKNECLGIFLRS